MKKLMALFLAILFIVSICVPVLAADEGQPVYIAVYGLNQLNRDCIWAWSSAGHVEYIQIWDGGTCIESGWLEPDHDYTLKVRVECVTVAVENGKPQVYTNGVYGWSSYGGSEINEGKSYVTAKITFHTPKCFWFLPNWYIPYCLYW